MRKPYNLEYKWELTIKLINRRVFITGGSQGFGFAVTKLFLKEGASVYICGRNLDALKQAAESLDGAEKLHYISADISIPNQIINAIEIANDQMGGIDILIANAAVHGPKGKLDQIDWNEWSSAIDINLKGTVLTCKAVLPHFIKQQYGKIIVLSGGGATQPRPYLSAYAASKAAVVRFAENLAYEVREHHIDVNSIAPGALNTRLLDDILSAGAEKVGEQIYNEALKQKEQGGAPLEIGARLCVYLASSQSDGITGKLISALWDPWQQFDKIKQPLQLSDIYTLRRIAPEDRQQNWSQLCTK